MTLREVYDSAFLDDFKGVFGMSRIYKHEHYPSDLTMVQENERKGFSYV